MRWVRSLRMSPLFNPMTNVYLHVSDIELTQKKVYCFTIKVRLIVGKQSSLCTIYFYSMIPGMIKKYMLALCFFLFLLQETTKLFGFQLFWLWEYPMKVISDTGRAHLVRYLILYCTGNQAHWEGESAVAAPWGQWV